MSLFAQRREIQDKDPPVAGEPKNVGPFSAMKQDLGLVRKADNNPRMATISRRTRILIGYRLLPHQEPTGNADHDHAGKRDHAENRRNPPAGRDERSVGRATIATPGRDLYCLVILWR